MTGLPAWKKGPVRWQDVRDWLASPSADGLNATHRNIVLNLTMSQDRDGIADPMAPDVDGERVVGAAALAAWGGVSVKAIAAAMPKVIDEKAVERVDSHAMVGRTQRYRVLAGRTASTQVEAQTASTEVEALPGERPSKARRASTKQAKSLHPGGSPTTATAPQRAVVGPNASAPGGASGSVVDDPGAGADGRPQYEAELRRVALAAAPALVRTFGYDEDDAADRAAVLFRTEYKSLASLLTIDKPPALVTHFERKALGINKASRVLGGAVMPALRELAGHLVVVRQNDGGTAEWVDLSADPDSLFKPVRVEDPHVLAELAANGSTAGRPTQGADGSWFLGPGPDVTADMGYVSEWFDHNYGGE